jgi:hypothetical protein
LLPSGKAYASKCIKFDDFSDNDFDDKWTVENEGDCYDYSVQDGKLEVIGRKINETCGENNRIFFIPKTSKQVKSIRVEVTQNDGYLCHRARVIADPVIMRKGIGFEQLAIMEPNWGPRPDTMRFHCPDPGMSRYMLSDGSSSLYDGFFKGDLFSAGWPTIGGKTYILYLSVRKNEITSRISDKSTRRDLGTIIFAPPGRLKNKGHILGLSCFGPQDKTDENSSKWEVSSGTVLYDNVYLCF